MNTKKVKLTEIKPYWRNPRKNAKAEAAVKASIEAYGYTVPIVVDGENTIILGHVRYKVLKSLGRKTIEVIVADHLTAQQVTAFRIAENKTHEFAEWDTEKLRAELALPDMDELKGYFEGEEWAGLWEVEGEPEEPEPESPAPDPANPPPGSNLGEDEAPDCICPHCGHIQPVPPEEPPAEESQS